MTVVIGERLTQQCRRRRRRDAEQEREMNHPDKRVQDAIIKLNDALCSWERATGRESVLIIREQGGFFHRSISGRPLRDSDLHGISDGEFIENIII